MLFIPFPLNPFLCIFFSPHLITPVYFGTAANRAAKAVNVETPVSGGVSEVPHALRVKPFQRRQKKINSKFPSSWPQHPSWAGHSKFELGSQASAQIRPLARLHRCHPSRPDSERTECRKRNRLRSNMLLVPDQAITSTHNADAEPPVNIGKPF
jgi:hypothetical protein